MKRIAWVLVVVEMSGFVALAGAAFGFGWIASGPIAAAASAALVGGGGLLYAAREIAAGLTDGGEDA